MKGIKKRKKIPIKTLKLFEYVFDIEQKKSTTFESANKYCDWVFTTIVKYNKIQKTKFSDDYVGKYITWKSNKERNG